VLEGLSSKPLREFLRTIGEGLHQNFEAPPKSLGSRTLLQRVSLVTCLINNFRPNWAEVPSLVRIAEGKEKGAEPGLKDELEAEHKRVRDDFAALAFLYDLRTFGGLAHLPSKRGISNAAANLGLPAGSWHRNDYLELLDRITESVSKISLRMESAAELISETLGPAR
jgi:hypothetical protein